MRAFRTALTSTEHGPTHAACKERLVDMRGLLRLMKLDKHLPHIIPAQHGARKRQEAGNTRVQAVSGELTFDRSTHAVAKRVLNAGP